MGVGFTELMKVDLTVCCWNSAHVENSGLSLCKVLIGFGMAVWLREKRQVMSIYKKYGGSAAIAVDRGILSEGNDLLFYIYIYIDKLSPDLSNSSRYLPP